MGRRRLASGLMKYAKQQVSASAECGSRCNLAAVGHKSCNKDKEQSESLRGKIRLRH